MSVLGLFVFTFMLSFATEMCVAHVGWPAGVEIISNCLSIQMNSWRAGNASVGLGTTCVCVLPDGRGRLALPQLFLYNKPEFGRSQSRSALCLEVQ